MASGKRFRAAYVSRVAKGRESLLANWFQKKGRFDLTGGRGRMRRRKCWQKGGRLKSRYLDSTSWGRERPGRRGGSY